MGKIADGMSKATTIVGAMVGIVRNTLRDIIAEVVGACISKALQAATVVLIPKVAAEVAILVSETSAKILNVLKRLFTAIKEMGVLTKQMSAIVEQIGQANRNVLRLEAFRLEAAAGSSPGWTGVSSAYNLLGQGHVSVYGTVDKVAVETARSASQTNGAQNTGATGTTLTGENPAPTAIDLPL